MRTPKKFLQDWLGITALANKIVNEDLSGPEMSGDVVEEIGKVFLSLGNEEDIDVIKGYKS